MTTQNQQSFPNDSEAESCIHCYGNESDACGNCNGTGRGEDWASCAECGEWTWNHGTGRYQQCQACRLAEWETCFGRASDACAEAKRPSLDQLIQNAKGSHERAEALRREREADPVLERMLEGMR
jgi:hypothetical protein